MKTALMTMMLMLSSVFLSTLLRIHYFENTCKCGGNLAYKNCMKFGHGLC